MYRSSQLAVLAKLDDHQSQERGLLFVVFDQVLHLAKIHVARYRRMRRMGVPLTQIVEKLRSVIHPLMKAPDEFPMLNWIAFEVGLGAIALHGQVDNKKTPVADLLRSQHATNLIRASSMKLMREFSHALFVNHNVDHYAAFLASIAPSFSASATLLVMTPETSIGRVSKGCSNSHSLRKPMT